MITTIIFLCIFLGISIFVNISFLHFLGDYCKNWPELKNEFDDKMIKFHDLYWENVKENITDDE